MSAFKAIKEIDSDLENPLYMMLFQLASTQNVQHILEVGSASGDGTTRILAQAIAGSEAHLYCLEAQPERFQSLQQRYASNDQVTTLPYLSVYPAQFPGLETVVAHWQEGKSLLKQYPLEKISQWYQGEKDLADTSPQVSGIAYIKEKYGITHFDLVLLDGAEFLGAQDYEAVKGASLLVLDDTLSYKNQALLAQLKADPDYYLLYAFDRWGHGCAAFKRKSPLLSGVSVVIHTRNESKNISDCLLSLQKLPSEIIVVDMYSEDDTFAQVKALESQGLPIRWISHVPTNGVDIARNFGLSQVRYDWTLVLDADERLNDDLLALLSELKTVKKEPAGYWIARQNIFFNAPAKDLFPDYQLRFFQSYQVQWPAGVHHYPQLQGKSEQLPIQAHFIHFSYYTVAEFVERQQHYADVYWKNMQLSDAAIQSQIPDLRKHYDHRVEGLQKQVKNRSLDDHTWLIQHLYLFSELTQLATAMEKSGHFSKLALRAPRLSAYSYLKNGLRFDYPFCESLLAILPVCDEVVVTYATDSEDDTFAVLQKLARLFPHLKLYPSEVWRQKEVLDGKRIALAATEARDYCQGDWLWHVQADEVYLRKDTFKVKALIQEYDHQPIDAFVFPVLHFYADYEHYVNHLGPQEGWYLSCVRLTRRGKAEHVGDAWTQHIADAQRLKSVDIPIFHYGHVREHESMRLKSNYMEQLYKKLPENFEVCPPEAFTYDRVPRALLNRFQQSHPETMMRRISRQRLQQAERKRQGKAKPKLLVISRLPGLKKGYAITLSSIYQQHILQSHYEVHHLAWHYYDKPFMTEGVHIYPDNQDGVNDPQYLKALLYSIRPDVILLHADAHFFIPYMPVLQAWKGPIVGWFTVDYEQNQNPSTLVAVLQRCQRLLGLADFGITQMARDYTGSIGKVPLGVDTQYFKPVSSEHKHALRQQWEVPLNACIFLMVANNFWRKGLEYAIQSFFEYCERYPEAGKNSFLYLHTERTVELVEQVRSLGLSRKVMITPQYHPIKKPLPTAALAELYQLSDIFLLTTLGEGFGMTLLEAQATGLPIIVSDNSVIREVTQENALFIPCPGRVPGKTGERMVWMKAPNTTEAAFLMHQLYQDENLRFELAEKGLQDVRHYNWESTAQALAGELALVLETGELIFDFPEPQLKAI
jgi:glycosyltransferase involved in cell wall biosynthesis